ncbi:HPP family protein [Gymnopilus junonius]|uniref:HPP family protein n=1 Tax=Gymnopilus junonius TaxID=109634 RepID=A0A9P5TJ01_GYMJU|nr:HPP family protein [Gymnopilus junonius]
MTNSVCNQSASSTLSRLPPWMSRWLGYHAEKQKVQLHYVMWIWTFIGAFCGMSRIQAVFGQAHYFIKRGVPPIIASYGASAVLIYGTVDAPLSQPRGLFAGHFLGALIEERFKQLVWLAGSWSCAMAIVVMQMTGTTHPPTGATMLLAAVNVDVQNLGWYYLPVILLSSALALVVALIINNIQCR